MEIIINGTEYWNIEPQKYYSFTAAFKGDKKAKARELVMSDKYLGARKMDGFWSMIIKDGNGDFHLRSRDAGVNGFTDKAEWIPHICEELKSIPDGTVLIGEIYFPDDEGSRKVTSVLNCLKDKCLKRQENKKLHFYIFDILSWGGQCLISMPFEQRTTYLNLEVFKDLNFIETAQYVRGQELWDLWVSTIEEGGEGIVITREDCPYMCGKRTAWMTLKMKKELQDPIDAFIDGEWRYGERVYTGKELETWPYWENNKTGEKYNTCMIEAYRNGEPIDPVKKPYFYGWASSISFSVMKDGVPTHIAWVSNITDQLKEEIVTKPEKWKGKVVRLIAMQLECIDGNYSFRHGRIDSWRDDKSPEDCDYSQITDQKTV